MRPGGDLASLYTQEQLDFLWTDPARPDAQEWIGIKIGAYGKTYNPDGEELPFTISGSIEGGSMKWGFTLPAGRVQGKLQRVSIFSDEFMAMVCDAPADGDDDGDDGDGDDGDDGDGDDGDDGDD